MFGRQEAKSTRRRTIRLGTCTRLLVDLHWQWRFCFTFLFTFPSKLFLTFLFCQSSDPCRDHINHFHRNQHSGVPFTLICAYSTAQRSVDLIRTIVIVARTRCLPNSLPLDFAVFFFFSFSGWRRATYACALESSSSTGASIRCSEAILGVFGKTVPVPKRRKYPSMQTTVHDVRPRKASSLPGGAQRDAAAPSCNRRHSAQRR